MSDIPASIPDAVEIAEYLVHNPEDADYVVQMPQRIRIEPEEIWIDGICIWLRTDGSYASADRGRGSRIFEGPDRAELAKAVAYWKTSFHAQAIEARRAETHSGSVHESAVAESHAPNPLGKAHTSA